MQNMAKYENSVNLQRIWQNESNIWKQIVLLREKCEERPEDHPFSLMSTSKTWRNRGKSLKIIKVYSVVLNIHYEWATFPKSKWQKIHCTPFKSLLIIHQWPFKRKTTAGRFIQNDNANNWFSQLLFLLISLQFDSITFLSHLIFCDTN